MALEQEQALCLRCGRHTLHQRSPYQVPHLGHFFATLFTAGLWLPFWIGHSVANYLSAEEPFRCTQCGQAAGDPVAAAIVPPEPLPTGPKRAKFKT